MKFLCERDALQEALSSVVGRTKARSPLPILSHLRLEASGRSVKITGHDLDSSSEVTLPADVSREGAAAVPGERLQRLVSGLAKGAQVSVSIEDGRAGVRAGRSSYSFSTLPAEDFPDPLSPKDPVELRLTAEQARMLFDVPAISISAEQTRIYICGLYLHRKDKLVAACTTNGHTLIRTAVAVADAPEFEGVLVPEQACAELAKFVDDGDLVLQIARNCVAVERDGRRFATKLIDATFPDYERVIPQANPTPITLDVGDFDAALARLDAARDKETSPIVSLSWDNKVAHINASLRNEKGEGVEEIDCDCSGRDAGGISFQIQYVRNLIKASGGEVVRLLINGPGEPARFESPQQKEFIGVCMPCGR